MGNPPSGDFVEALRRCTAASAPPDGRHRSGGPGQRGTPARGEPYRYYSNIYGGRTSRGADTQKEKDDLESPLKNLKGKGETQSERRSAGGCGASPMRRRLRS